MLRLVKVTMVAAATLLGFTGCGDINVDGGGADAGTVTTCQARCIQDQPVGCDDEGNEILGQKCTGAFLCQGGVCVPGGDVVEDATPDAIADSSPPDVIVDTNAPDAVVDTGPETSIDAAPDTVVTPDAVLDESTPDAVADGAADTGPDVAPDAQPDVCIPQCSGAQCGSDGCGGDCGLCPDNGSVCDSGQCVCTPQASSDCVGSDVYWFDSCGAQGALQASCPFGCAGGQCDNCTPVCSGKVCGPDGCGGSCGTCSGDGEVCDNGTGMCVCTANAYVECSGGNVYSMDSCGNLESLVETCTWGCTGGACDGCAPQCGTNTCGPDGCGGDCGTCASSEQCLDYSGDGQGDTCVCQPDCQGKSCGPDGCGDTCGACSAPTGVCSTSFSCVQCESTTDCPAGLSCDSGNTCVGCVSDGDCTVAGESCVAGTCQAADCGPPSVFDKPSGVGSQSYTHTSSCPFITVYLWGGGGGGGRLAGGDGAAGGFASATLSPSSGQMLNIVVGGGGEPGLTGFGGAGGSGGGGDGGDSLGSGGNAGGGGGGGLSAVGGSGVGALPMIIAGGGGGGGGNAWDSEGGVAGQPSGEDGFGDNGGVPGEGGTQTSGGMGGQETNGASGSNGVQLNGGDGAVANNGGGGGGGGGFFGGGGGSSFNPGGAGGGGGGSSSFDPSAPLSDVVFMSGSGVAFPAGSSVYHNGTAAAGGLMDEPGADGLVVIVPHN